MSEGVKNQIILVHVCVFVCVCMCVSDWVALQMHMLFIPGWKSRGKNCGSLSIWIQADCFPMTHNCRAAHRQPTR